MSFRARVLNKAPFAAVRARYVVCECADVCLRACLCMCDCACVVFIHVGKDLKRKLLFIILECDSAQPHWGREVGELYQTLQLP